MEPSRVPAWYPPSYRQAKQWLEFQFCAYGECQKCDVFTELLCLKPCTTYEKFTKPDKNHIMQHCAARVGLDWPRLQACTATGSEADTLQRASAAATRARQAIYGTKGLPVVTIGTPGSTPTRVRTAQKIPFFCGPTPLEWLTVLCDTLAQEGRHPPRECGSTEGMCSVIVNATRLPECRRISYAYSLSSSAVVPIASLDGSAAAAATAKATTIFVTSAEGGEGTAMVLQLLALNTSTVWAGVASVESAASKALAQAGAVLKVVSDPPVPAPFVGADYVFLLAPLTSDRLEVAIGLADAAKDAGAINAVLLSVVGTSAAPDCPASLLDYHKIEQHVAAHWPSSRYCGRWFTSKPTRP